MITYGFELETVGASPRRLAAILANAGFNAQAEGYNHVTREHWKAVSDGSLHTRLGSGEAGEVVSPILNLGSFGELKKVTRALSAAGVRVNKSCGLHVHVGGIDLSREGVLEYARAWIALQPAIDLLVAPSRRGANCGYAKRLNGHDLEYIANGDYGSLDRYKTFNASSLLRQPTVEIRQHQGSLNASKIWAWTEFISNLFTVVSGGARFSQIADELSLNATLELLDAVNLSDDSKRILTERATDFAEAL